MPDNPTPDTLSFLLLGLGAIAFIMLLLIGSIALRWRSLQQDAEMIRQLHDEE